MKYESEEEVEKYIDELVDGGDDGLDRLKELGEGLKNEGKFGRNMSKGLSELGSELEGEVSRGKKGEKELGCEIKIVKDKLVKWVNRLNGSMVKVVEDISRMIEGMNGGIEKVEEGVGDLEVESENKLSEGKEYGKELVDKEGGEGRGGDEKVREGVDKVELEDSRDIGELNNKIVREG